MIRPFRNAFNATATRRQQVSRWLEQEVPEYDVSPAVSGPIFRSSNGRLYKAISPAFSGPIAIKECLQCGTDDASPDEARRQFAALTRVKAAFAGSTAFRVPTAFPLLLDRGCLVMEWIEGQSLRALWTDWSLPVALLAERTRQAGEWLRSFHQAYPLPAKNLDTESLLGPLEHRLTQSKHRSRVQPSAHAAVMLLARSARGIGTRPLPASWVHGDFKAANLLLTDAGVVGLDIALRHEAPIVMDVAQFLIDLHLNCLEPSALRLAPSRMKLERAFLSGYGLTDTPFETARLWLQLLFLLVKRADLASPSMQATDMFLKGRLSVLIPQVTKQLRNALGISE